jgi:hypothetical protein
MRRDDPHTTTPVVLRDVVKRCASVTFAVGLALASLLRGLFEGELPRLPSLVADPEALT